MAQINKILNRAWRISSTSFSSLRPCTISRPAAFAVSPKSSPFRVFSAEPSEKLPTSFEDISTAMFRIRSGIVRTECKKSHFLSEICGMEVYLKLEFTQYTGSFKERGARNALMLLPPEDREKGVIAASAGNHAQALAWHGKLLDIPITVIMPTVAPMTKIEKCRKFGANVVIAGAHIGESRAIAIDPEGEYHHIRYVNGYDDREIIAGAGTIGIEILEQVPDCDAIIVPVGGAGLIAGISQSVKTLKRQGECKVFGVEPAFCASYIAALNAGKVVTADCLPTLADGLAVPAVGPNAFEVARRYVDECVTVDEKSIALSVLRLVETEKMVVEGGGAAGLAAILPGGPLHGRPELKDKRVVIPLCGGNIDTTVLGRVIDRGLAADGRLVRFVATVSDRPGGIARLTQIVSEVGVSMKDIQHERAWLHSAVDKVQVKCVVETTGLAQGRELYNALKKEGYPIIWGAGSSQSIF